jgi:deoxypyrimidine-specific 5' nucleotidase type C protein (NT5C)
VPLRIGFDLDGVFADMETALIRCASDVFGEAMIERLQERARENSPADTSTAPESEGAADTTGPTVADNTPPILRIKMTPRQTSRLWRHVQTIENFWQDLQEIEPGSLERLAAIAAERRWEIIFLTKRPATAGATAQVQSQKWLEAKGFPLPSVFVVQGSRGRIAQALGLDIVVDDRPENCLDVVTDSKARAVLVWREKQQGLPTAARRLGIGVVESISECLDILVQVDTMVPEETGIFNRVMRILGRGAKS